MRLALVGVLALVVGTGCAGQRKQIKEPDLRPMVGRVQLQGLDELKATDIRPHLGQGQTHFLHFSPIGWLKQYRPVRLDGDTWEDDKTRIANLYALRGFFDARVVASQVLVRNTRKDGTPRWVRIVHTIDEGEPSAVTKITLNVPEELRDELSAGLPIAIGDRFSMKAVDDAEKLIRSRLAALAYARAKVTAQVDAYPERQAVEVTIDVERGAPARFGAVTLTGLETIRERYVLRHVRIEEGEPWDARKVAQTQQAIYDMGVFSLVTVAPDMDADIEPEPDGTEIVPVAIILKERKPRQFTYGGGLTFTASSIAFTGRLGIEHVNAFRRLVHFKADLVGGLKILGPEDVGPLLDLDVSLRWPDFPVKTIDVFVGGAVELDVETGYKYVQPEAEAGVVWSPWRPLKLSTTYSVLYFALYDDRLDELDVGTETLFDDGYLLTTLSPQLILDFRDNLLAPNQGFYFSAAVDAALPPGAYNYVRSVGDVRGYIPLGTKRIVLAVRATGSYIHKFGDTKDSDVPIDERIFAGGDGSVRGWKSRYLGPRGLESDCDRRDCIIPLGGEVGFTGSVELRGNPVGGLWLAGFTDFGRVWDSPDDITSAKRFAEDLQVSIGGGIRYDIAIGRIRLDFAVHPKPWTDDVFREEVIKPLSCVAPGVTVDCPDDLLREPFNWNIHFGLGESF